MVDEFETAERLSTFNLVNVVDLQALLRYNLKYQN